MDASSLMPIVAHSRLEVCLFGPVAEQVMGCELSAHADVRYATPPTPFALIDVRTDVCMRLRRLVALSELRVGRLLTHLLARRLRVRVLFDGQRRQLGGRRRLG